jgi:hypothetical protein
VFSRNSAARARKNKLYIGCIIAEHRRPQRLATRGNQTREIRPAPPTQPHTTIIRSP